jgi:hypothetical protein
MTSAVPLTRVACTCPLPRQVVKRRHEHVLLPAPPCPACAAHEHHQVLLTDGTFLPWHVWLERTEPATTEARHA